MEKTSNSYVSLNNIIEFGKCEALNAQGNFSVKETFGYGGTTKSNEGDPELIFSITFKEKASITGIMIEAFDSDCAPTEIRLYSQKKTIDFSDIDDTPATETLKVTSGKILGLKLAKYKNIDNLALFMKNDNAKLLKINNIQLYGSSGENTDMSQVKNTNP